MASEAFSPGEVANISAHKSIEVQAANRAACELLCIMETEFDCQFLVFTSDQECFLGSVDDAIPGGMENAFDDEQDTVLIEAGTFCLIGSP